MLLIHKMLFVAFIHSLSLACPGPDFLMVTRNSLIGSPRLGIWTAMGITTSNTIHLVLSFFFSAYFIQFKVGEFNILKFLGSLYLAWVGFKYITSKRPQVVSHSLDLLKKTRSSKSAYLEGLIASLLNAKALTYFFTITIQFISKNQSDWINLIIIFEFIAISATWFCLIASFSGYKIIRRTLTENSILLERGIGILLLCFSGLTFKSFLLKNI